MKARKVLKEAILEFYWRPRQYYYFEQLVIDLHAELVNEGKLENRGDYYSVREENK
jgi:hypothetical protein